MRSKRVSISALIVRVLILIIVGRMARNFTGQFLKQKIKQKLVLYLGQLVREARLCSIRKETRGFLLSQAITRHHVNHETDEKPRNENLQ